MLNGVFRNCLWLVLGNYGYQTGSNGRSLRENYKYCVNKSRDMSRDHFA